MRQPEEVSLEQHWGLVAVWDQPASNAHESQWGRSSGEAKPGQLGENILTGGRQAVLLLPASLLQNRWGCQPTWELCLDLFCSCRETSWPRFNVQGDPLRGFVCSLRSSGQQLQKCLSVLRSRDILCDLGQPKVLALLLGNSSHLHYKIQHKLSSDHVVALINVRAEVWLSR